MRCDRRTDDAGRYLHEMQSLQPANRLPTTLVALTVIYMRRDPVEFQQLKLIAPLVDGMLRDSDRDLLYCGLVTINNDVVEIHQQITADVIAVPVCFHSSLRR